MHQHYINNLKAARKRSLAVWNAFPTEFHHWKPDENAQSVLEMIQHVYSAQIWFTKLIESRGDVAKIDMPTFSIASETLSSMLDWGHDVTNDFYNFINRFSEQDFETYIIDRTDKKFTMKLGDFLLRAAYHEATHTGQLLSYLRILDIPRPNIWDIY